MPPKAPALTRLDGLREARKRRGSENRRKAPCFRMPLALGTGRCAAALPLDTPAPRGSPKHRGPERRAGLLLRSSQGTPLSIAGRIIADLWVSVDSPDADWAVKLVERCRRYHFTIDLGPTA